MSETEEKELLNEDYINHIPDDQYHDPRIIKILSWLHKQYIEPLSLQDIAEKAGMNKAAFCRFFKKKTGKTCFEYITELRINYACKLLKEANLPVTQICYETGFNNISNFNRQFKKIIIHTYQLFYRNSRKQNKNCRQSVNRSLKPRNPRAGLNVVNLLSREAG